MKKILSILLVLCTILTLSVTAFAQRPVKLFVGGDQVVSDVPPQIIEGRTMLPLRAAFEAIGATVSWDDDTKTVTATKGNTEIKLTIGSKTMFVNGAEKTLDVAAYIENGRTMVPVRACSEAFGLKVDWFPSANTVKVRMEVDVESEKNYGDGAKTWNSFDANGNYTEYNDNIGDHSHEEYTYDSNDNLIEYTNKYDQWIKYEYDGYGNLITETNSYDEKITYAYNEQNRLIYKEKDGETEEITYYDEEGYFEISYSNKKRGKNYKSETRYYSSVENLTTWHVSYPFNYYVAADNMNMNDYKKMWDRQKTEYTATLEDNGNTSITTPQYKYTFNANGLILRCEPIPNDGKLAVIDYIRDVNGKLLYTDTYNPIDISSPHLIQKYTRVTR